MVDRMTVDTIQCLCVRESSGPGGLGSVPRRPSLPQRVRPTRHVLVAAYRRPGRRRRRRREGQTVAEAVAETVGATVVVHHPRLFRVELACVRVASGGELERVGGRSEVGSTASATERHSPPTTQTGSTVR